MSDSPEVDEYRSWCRLHVRESPGFDLADAAIAGLEGHIHSSADWLRAQTAEAELAALKELLAATQKALIIEPGKTYAVEAPDYATTEQIEHLGKMWREMTCSHVVIFADGWRIARERVEIDGES